MSQDIAAMLADLDIRLDPWQREVVNRLVDAQLNHGGNLYLRPPYRRASSGYTPPRENPRITALHRAYRQRALARRRRNR